MEFGRYPGVKSLTMLSERLKALAVGKPLGSGVLYTFTAIARTLNRSDFPLPIIPELRKTWETSASRTFSSNDLIDQV
jgi:hypothetical protein